MSIRIIIADDHRIFREGVRTLLDRENDIEVIAEAENGRKTVDLSLDLKPDVVIMDITMPDLNGIEATRQIIEKNARVRIIALSMHSDKRFISGMIRAGASGYLLKDCAFEDLARAIRMVANGETFLSPRIAGIVLDQYIRASKGEATGLGLLTDREREVLQQIAEGYACIQISKKLHLSVKTVETHRKKIMDKLEIRTVAELTKFAVREGLTSLEP
jgi:two-component system, NarL family, response regulator NreC